LVADLASTLFVQVGYANQLDARQVRANTAVSLAHYACANDTYLYRIHSNSPEGASVIKLESCRIPNEMWKHIKLLLLPERPKLRGMPSQW
jgi:hypothetical protein